MTDTIRSTSAPGTTSVAAGELVLGTRGDLGVKAKVAGPVPLPAEAAGAADGAAATGALSPLAALIAGHLIRDDEIIVLLLKPSLWYVLLSSMMTLGVSGVLVMAGLLFGSGGGLPVSSVSLVNLGVLVAVARLMLAMLQWMGRFYILTDQRVMTVSGVVHTAVFQCPLRRVARVRLLRTSRDRLLNVGQVEIIPQDEELPISVWQTVSSPAQIRDRVAAAVARAKSGGRGA